MDIGAMGVWRKKKKKALYIFERKRRNSVSSVVTENSIPTKAQNREQPIDILFSIGSPNINTILS